MKQCSKCNEYKSEDDFYISKKRKDGLQPYCKKCLKITTLSDYYDNNRKDIFLQRANDRRNVCRKYVNEIKSERGCYFCGEKEFVCLDFHHLEQEGKDKPISFLVAAKSMKKLIKEIEKCIVVCANCHRKIHSGLLSTDGVVALRVEHSPFKRGVVGSNPTGTTKKEYEDMYKM